MTKKPTKKQIRAILKEVPMIARKIPVNTTAVSVIVKYTGEQLMEILKAEGKPTTVEGKPIDPKAIYTSSEWKFVKIDHNRKLRQYVKKYGVTAVEEYMAFLRANKAKMERMFPEQFGPKETKQPIPDGRLSMQEVSKDDKVNVAFGKAARYTAAIAENAATELDALGEAVEEVTPSIKPKRKPRAKKLDLNNKQVTNISWGEGSDPDGSSHGFASDGKDNYHFYIFETEEDAHTYVCECHELPEFHKEGLASVNAAIEWANEEWKKYQ